jgi:hypothetical protein
MCQLLEIDTWNTYGILFSVEQMTFFCRAVEIPKKSVKQSKFEQMDFEQLTPTQTDWLTYNYFLVIQYFLLLLSRALSKDEVLTFKHVKTLYWCLSLSYRISTFE